MRQQVLLLALLSLWSGSAHAVGREGFLVDPAYVVTQRDCGGIPQAPRMSHSGKEMLFECLVKKHSSLWTAVFSKRPQPLRDGQSRKVVSGENPVWHPDGRHIAYQEPGGSLRIAVLERAMLTRSATLGEGRRPQFSKPLGHTIFFETVEDVPQLRYRFLGKDVLSTKDGVGLLRGPVSKLTAHSFSHPNWSWDGSTIFFAASPTEMISSKQEDNEGDKTGEGIQELISGLQILPADAQRMVELHRKLGGSGATEKIREELKAMSSILKKAGGPLSAAGFMKDSGFEVVYGPPTCPSVDYPSGPVDLNSKEHAEFEKRCQEEQAQQVKKQEDEVEAYRRRSPEALSKELVARLPKFRKQPTIVSGFTRRDLLVGWVYGIFQMTEQDVMDLFLPRLWKTDIFGAAITKVANDDAPLPQKWPAPDPSGEYVAFEAGHFKNRHIYIAKVSTGNVVQLTEEGSYNSSPEISPDGRFLLFESNRGGLRGIVRAGLDWPRIRTVLERGGSDLD